MKQKFLIIKGDAKSDTVVREQAELEKKEFSLVFEGAHKTADIKTAIAAGTKALIKALRNKDFFPPDLVMTKIVNAMIALFEDAKQDSVEVAVDDRDQPEVDDPEQKEETDEEGDIDELLEDDLDEADSATPAASGGDDKQDKK